MEKRNDNFKELRNKFKKFSDQELHDYFWSLTEQIVSPLIELAMNSTSPSIERSVLLRMGFSSIEANKIVTYAMKFCLLGKGAGNIVLIYSELINKDYLDAGRELSKGIGWEKIDKTIKYEGKKHE